MKTASKRRTRPSRKRGAVSIHALDAKRFGLKIERASISPAVRKRVTELAKEHEAAEAARRQAALWCLQAALAYLRLEERHE